MREAVSRPAVTLCFSAVLATTSACDSWQSPEARIALAESAAAKGDSATAVVQLRKVVAKQPEHLQARLLLARHLALLGDAQGGARILDGAQPTDDLRPQWASLRCEVALQVGQHADLLKRIDEGKSGLEGIDRMVCRGQALAGLRRNAAAQAEFERVLAQQPDNIAAATGLAETFVAQGRAEDALAVVEPILARQPDHLDARLVQANAFLQRGRYNDAATALGGGNDAGLSVFQRARRAMLLVDVHLALGEVEEAAKAHQSLAQAVPGSVAARLTGARVALAKGDYLNGTAELQRLVSAAPQMLRARMQLAVAHYSQGSYRQAERHLEQILQIAPDHIEARKLLARVKLEIDQPEAALRMLSPALDADFYDPQAYWLLGGTQLRSGESVQGVEALEKTVRENPRDAAASRELALLYLIMGRNTQALALLRATPAEPGSASREALLLTAVRAEQGTVAAAAELDKLLRDQPQNPELMLLAAAFYASRQEFDRARAALNARLKADPRDAAALSAAARVEFATGNLLAAEQMLMRAVAADPSRPETRLALARFYLASSDAARVRGALDEAVAAGQGRADVVNAAGLVLLDAQRFDEALALFRQATDLDAGEPTYWLNVARAQVALGRTAPAREALERAIQLRPDSIGAQTLFAWLDLGTGGAEAALERARSLHARWPHSPAPKVLEGDLFMTRRQYDEAVTAYREAERLGGDATLAVKLFDARRLANHDRPEEPLERWLALHPQDLRVRGVLATHFGRTERPARAAAELETMLESRPNDPALLTSLAWNYHAASDRRAEEAAARAYRLAPRDPAVGDAYGWILLSRKKTDRSVQVLSAAAQAAPADAKIQYHYGAALAAAGRTAEARDRLARALRSRTAFDERRNAENLLDKLSR